MELRVPVPEAVVPRMSQSFNPGLISDEDHPLLHMLAIVAKKQILVLFRCACACCCLWWVGSEMWAIPDLWDPLQSHLLE